MRTYKKFYRLSNGYYLAIYTTKHKQRMKKTAYIVAVCISNERVQLLVQESRTSGRKGRNSRNGGRIKAIRWLKELEKAIDSGESIVIYWVDDRRRRALSI